MISNASVLYLALHNCMPRIEHYMRFNDCMAASRDDNRDSAFVQEIVRVLYIFVQQGDIEFARLSEQPQEV
jgi:hypothetical protein